MVVLKNIGLSIKYWRHIKLKGSTLVESLVASVIIVIVFTIASLTLNNVFRSSIKSNTDGIQNRLNKLAYLYHNDKIQSPYQETFNNWHIQLLKSDKEHAYFRLEAVQLNSQKTIFRKLTYEHAE